MKIFLSPAKLMSVDYQDSLLTTSAPQFIEKSEFIQSFLKEKSPNELQEIMSISDNLADENWGRNQNWNPQPNDKESAQAVFAFRGPVYRHLAPETLGKKELDYLQKNLMLLSGLYGILRPADRIMLYRLEMGSKFDFDAYKNLYAFWKETLTEYLDNQLTKNEFILNLASKEYSKVIDRKKINAPFVEVDFKQIKNDKLKTIVIYTKQARGKMARYCAENNVQTLDEVKAFSEDGYLLNDELSSDKKLVFTR